MFGASAPRRPKWCLALTRYCYYHIVWRMAYNRGGGGPILPNTIATVWEMQAGRKNERTIDSCTNG